MIMSKFGKTLQNTCFTIKQMKKQQKLNFHDNPKHEATKSSNSGPRKKLLFLTFCPVDLSPSYVKPLRNLTVPLMRARDNKWAEEAGACHDFNRIWSPTHIIYIYMYIYIYIYIYTNKRQYIRQAFGPTACRDPFWMLQLSKGSTFNWSWGPLPPRNLASSNSAPRLDFLVEREGVQKWWFFGIAPKRQKSEDKSNMAGPCRHFGSKNMTCEVLFGIVFVNNIKSRKVFVFNTVQWFGTIKNHWFPIVFSLNFMCFQNCSPGPFLDGPSAKLL